MIGTRRDAFHAIADSTRRTIIDLLANRELTLNQIADNFRISRPAVSKHIKILAECGLVAIRQEGRERYCRVKPKKLDEVSLWLEKYRKFWEERLDRLENFLNEQQEKEKK